MANRVRNRGRGITSGPANQGHKTLITPVQVAPRAGEFSAKGKPHSARRPNNAQPRKMYARVRKEQKGTPMETFINKNNEMLEDQYNALRRGPGTMSDDDARGRLGTHWKNIKKAGTTGRAISKHIADYGGSVRNARGSLLHKHTVSFGADPVNR